MLTRLANAGLAVACAPASARLAHLAQRGDLAAQQAAWLNRVLTRNAATDVGRRYGFADLRTPRQFRARVPLSTWDALAPDLDRVARGERGVLTAEAVRLLEPTSGSSAAVKLVPYTAGLQADFNAGIRPWLFDLQRRYRALRAGRAYWSVTPAVTHPDAPGPLPVGFDDDADYLGAAKRLVNATFAVPGDVARATTLDAFRRRTLTALLAADDLALVSVWNPTFFTLLLDWASEHAAELAPALPRPRRGLRSAIADGDWTALWPRLAVVSCWADAQAARSASDLAERLPQAALQPKGLLATEAFTSLPLTAAGGAVLSARSHFFEFAEADADADGGTTRLAHELDQGRYEVVVTTSGGLYRYRTGDLVEVTGHHGCLPVLRFVGRADRVSDLVGEKLSDAFVAGALAAAGASGFAVLVPRPPRGYALLTDDPDEALADRVEAELRRGFHYDYARRLDQLDAVARVQLSPGASGRYLAACQARGQRLGDVKIPALDLRLDPAPDTA